VWPTEAPGHRATLKIPQQQGPDRAVEVVTQSVQPRVFTIDDVLTPEECRQIINAGKKDMKPSVMHTFGKKDGVRPGETQSRTSSTAWIPRHDPAFDWLRRKIATLTRVPDTHYESLQVIRYDQGQHYHPHTDYHVASEYKDPVLRETYSKNNRFITALLYLNDDFEGGETAFPWSRVGPISSDEEYEEAKRCRRGVAVRPKQGRVALFYNMIASQHRNAKTDPWSIHVGCDVVNNATKWAANYWISNGPYADYEPAHKKRRESELAKQKEKSAP